MDFMIAFMVLLFLLTFLKQNWTIHLIVLPLSMIPWALLGLGLGLILSVLYTFFRDIRPITQMLLMFTFFSSPILIKIDVFSGLFQESIFRFHPLTYFAALFQKPIYYSAWPNLIDWVFSFTTGIISLAVGYFLINHYRNKFYYYL
jgi:ABC-type polysaccharide/polyol phosphate export permease